MENHGIDIYYVPSSDYHQSEYMCDYFKTRRFISGFGGSAGTVVVTKDKAGLWVDGRYFIQAARDIAGTGIELYKMGESKVPTTTEFIVSEIKENGTLAFDGKVASIDTIKEIENMLNGKKINIIAKYDLIGEIWKNRPEIKFTEAFILDEKYTGESFKDKIKRIKEEMLKKKANYHVVTSLDDIAWIFNLRGHDIKNSPVNLAYALISMNRTVLYIDETKLNDKVKDYLMKNNIVIRDYNDIYREAVELQSQNILIDKIKVNYYLYEILKEKNKIIFADNPSVLMKACKNKVEIENTRDAHLKDAVACTKFMYWFKKQVKENKNIEKISELDISDKILEFRKEQKGYIEPSFDTIPAVGANAPMMHYRPTPERHDNLKLGKLLLIDSGAQYDNGTTDVTRTFAIGNIDNKLKEHFTLVLKGMLSLSKVKFLYGITGTNLDVLARAPIWKYGIDYKSGTGHGMGFVLNVHEGPHRIAPTYNSQKLEDGMIVSNEPGIYIEDSHGIRIENILLVQKAENTAFGQFMVFETLTLVPIDLDCMLPDLLDSEEKEFLNKYHKIVYNKVSKYLLEDEREWLKEYTREI
jgi:Xaa-Pro aminopeptidase